MRYESTKTEKGNVGVSYDSQEAADLQAVAMDENGCSDCTDCTDCHYCNCCNGCTGCSDCSDCTRCSDCFETQGALRWMGAEAKNLISINGLRWPVSTDGKSIQIGCQHHSVELWANFGDGEISCMDEEALTFWTWHKNTVLGLAEVRRLMDV